MATVVDALVVTFGLDDSQYRKGRELLAKDLKGLEATATVTAKSLESRGKQAAGFFSGIKTEALGLLGVLAGGAGLIAAAKSGTNELAALGRAAVNIGIATPALAAFRNAVEANGGSAEEATQSFLRLTQAAARLKLLGDASSVPGMGEIGAQPGDSPMQIARRFAAYADAHKNDVPRVNLVGQMLGLDQGTINELLRGAVQFSKDIAAATERGVPTEDQIKAVTDLQRAWNELWQVQTSIANNILAEVAPKLTGFLNWLQGLVLANKDLVTQMEVVGVAAATLMARPAMQMLLRLFGIGGAAAGAGAAGGGLLALLGRLLGPLAALGLTGAAGGEDAEFSKRKNDEYLRSRSGAAAEPSIWERLGRWWRGESDTRRPAETGGRSGGRSDGGPRNAGPLTDNARAAHDYFISQGYTEAQTAGILANLRAESGANLNPQAFNAAGGGQGAMGIAQWRGDRIDTFRRMHGGRSPLEATLQEQLAFIQWELTHTEAGAGRMLRGSRDAPGAAAAFQDYYERPGPEAASRGGYAEDYFRRFNDPSAARGFGLRNGVIETPQAAPSFTIGQVTINTQATDARGIASDLGTELRRLSVVTQANSGLA